MRCDSAVAEQDALRAEFARQLRAKREAHADRWGAYSRDHQFARDLVAEVEAAVRPLGWKPKKGKTVADTPLDSFTPAQRAIVEECRTRYTARVESVAGPAKAREKAADDELCRLAQIVDVRAGEEPREVRRVWTTTYASQGFGAESYARSSAEGALDAARSLGVRCDVLRVPDLDERGREKRTGQWAQAWPTYVARAWVAEELDVEVLRRRAVSLRETVRLMWARGSNPRVFIPGLPHGYEERAGLDHFGGETGAGAR